MRLSRRSLLAGAGSLAVGAAVAPRLSWATGGKRVLRLATRQIVVDGKAATRYGVLQDSGAFGLVLDPGDDLDVRLENTLDVPSGLHWHGLNPPWRQDGVPFLSGPPVSPGQSADYRFPAAPSGTRWMHSHFGLQEQDLLAAPLIVRDADAIKAGLQEVIIFLEDFMWKPPEEIFAGLRKPAAGMGGMDMKAGPDLNDVTYDAYLANDRTLSDPAVIDVEKNADVRLRIINAGASTNFTIDLGAIEGTLIAVDGNPVVPLKASRFPLATAQRADIIVRTPSDGSALPVLARGEGPQLQAGVFLRPPGATVTKIPEMGEAPPPVVGLEQEMLLRPVDPLPVRTIDRSVPVDLTGSMAGYVWGMAIHDLGGMPATVREGERVELVLKNTTGMAHPMHLHGHSFQVTEIDGVAFSGAIRDTVLVGPMKTVKVIFDAANPGLWAFHCHNLYHLTAGMFATVVYEGFS